MRSVPSPGLTLPMLALLAGAGCNAIAGIQEGELAAGQDGSTQQDSGSGQDATTADGGTDGHAGDASMADAAGDAVNTGEAGLLALHCAVDTNTTVLVDDLSTYDGGAGLDYIPGLWIARTSTSGQFWVVTQLVGGTTILTYEVDLVHGTSTTATQAGIGTAATLLDVSAVGTDGTTNNILASYPGGSKFVHGNGLQVIQLLDSLGESANNIEITDPAAVGYSAGRVTFVPSNSMWPWLVLQRSTILVTQPSLVVGPGTYVDGGNGALGLATGDGLQQLAAQQPFFDNAGEIYAFEQGVDPDGGTTVFAVPDDLDDAGVQGTIPAGSTILWAQPSAVDPTRALVVGDQTSGQSLQLYAGKVPFSQLTSVTLGSAAIPAGATIPLVDFPFANIGRDSHGDELAIVGSPADGSSGLVFVWLAPEGQPVSQLGQKIEDDGNQILVGAVSFQQVQSEALGATFYIAWIETAAPDGSTMKYDRIYAAQVTCTPPADGG